MFYEYSSPEHFYQRLHNKLSTVIVKTGQLLGLLWLEAASDSQTFIFGSKPLILWSITTFLFQFFTLTYITYHFYILTLFEDNIDYSTIISTTLVSVANVLFALHILVMYVTVIVRRKLILKVVQYSARLQNLLSLWKLGEKSKKCRKVLLYFIITKILLDCAVAIITTAILSVEFATTLDWMSFFYAFLDPVTMAGSCFITTMYYVSFAFGLFLMRKLSNNLNAYNCCFFSSYHQDILKVLRKVNSVMEFLMLVILFETFVGLVGQVSVFQCVLSFPIYFVCKIY